LQKACGNTALTDLVQQRPIAYLKPTMAKNKKPKEKTNYKVIAENSRTSRVRNANCCANAAS